MGRTNNVAHAVCNEENGGHGSLLRVPGNISSDQGQESDKDRRGGLCQIVSSKTTFGVGKRQSHNQDHSYDGGKETRRTDEESVAVSIA